MITAILIYCVLTILYVILCEIGDFIITGLSADRFILFGGATLVSIISYTTYSIFTNGSTNYLGDIYAAIFGASLMTLLAGVNVVVNIIDDRKYLNQ